MYSSILRFFLIKTIKLCPSGKRVPMNYFLKKSSDSSHKSDFLHAKVGYCPLSLEHLAVVPGHPLFRIFGNR